MCCSSTPIRQIGRRTAGTADLFVISISSSIQVPLSPPFNLKTISSAFTIKAGDNMPFVKLEWLNNYLKLEPNTDLIRMVCQRGSKKPWKEGPPIAKGVKGSSFAVVRYPDDEKLISCICYQDPQLHLRARYRDHSDTSDHSEWALGEQATEIYLSMSEYPSHFRFLQSWHTAAWNAHKCWSCSWWWCWCKCDVEGCTRTRCDWQLVQIIRLESTKRTARWAILSCNWR